MNWVLFFLIATVTPSDHFANSTTIPMATEQLCNAAKAQLTEAYNQFKSPYSVVMIQCLKSG